MNADLTPLLVANTYPWLLQMGGATNCGTLLNGIGSAFPIYMAGPQVLILDNFTPSYNMCILNALSANFFTSKPDASYTSVYRSSLISTASTGCWNQMAYMNNSIGVERTNGFVCFQENSFFAGYRTGGSIGGLSSWNYTVLHSGLQTDFQGNNTFVGPGNADSTFTDGAKQYRNTFYGYGQFQAGGPGACLTNNINTAVFRPIKSSNNSNINSSVGVYTIDYVNSVGSGAYGSINSIGGAYNPGQQVFSRNYDSLASSGRLNTCNSYIKYTISANFRDQYIQDSNVTQSDPFSAFCSHLDSGNNCHIQNIHNSFFLDHITDNCNHHGSVFLVYPSSNGTRNIFKGSGSDPNCNNDSVHLCCFYASMTSFAYANNVFCTTGLNSANTGLGGNVSHINSSVIGYTPACMPGTCCKNNTQLYVKDQGQICCANNSLAAGRLVGGPNSVSLYYFLNSNNRSAVTTITNATTCCLSGGGLIAQCFTIRNLPTSPAGLPCGHVWRCTADCTLRIVTS